jgi:hypothetical protein
MGRRFEEQDTLEYDLVDKNGIVTTYKCQVVTLPMWDEMRKEIREMKNSEQSTEFEMLMVQLSYIFGKGAIDYHSYSMDLLTKVLKDYTKTTVSPQKPAAQKKLEISSQK